MSNLEAVHLPKPLQGREVGQNLRLERPGVVVAEPVEVKGHEVDAVGPDDLDVAAERFFDPVGRRHSKPRGLARPGSAGGDRSRREVRQAESAVLDGRLGDRPLHAPEHLAVEKHRILDLGGERALLEADIIDGRVVDDDDLSEPVGDRHALAHVPGLFPEFVVDEDREASPAPDPVVAKPEPVRRDVLCLGQEGIPGGRPKPVPGNLEHEHERLRTQRIRSPGQLVRQESQSGLREAKGQRPVLERGGRRSRPLGPGPGQRLDKDG